MDETSLLNPDLPPYDEQLASFGKGLARVTRVSR
jgi:hypothetical protein